jgi:hypothetical protein
MEHSQLTPYGQIVAGLRGIGYQGALLEENYGFGDWFTPAFEERRIAAAAFGQTPVAYDSALIGVVCTNGVRGQSLVNQYRSLGAPVILEIDAGEIREWAVSYAVDAHRLIGRHPTDRISHLLAERAQEWKPDTFLRSKNIGSLRLSGQLELFSGLVPELEEQIQRKLDPLLHETLAATKEAYRGPLRRDPDESKLFKLVFWILTAKVFHDRRVAGFATLGSDPDQLLNAVANHYGVAVPPLLTKEARRIAADRIWEGMDFRNLSVEVLSHIWSTTLIDPETTKRLGIHRTSRTIVRYIIDRIPLVASGDDERIILEPCAGSAVFLIGAMNALRQTWFGLTPSNRHEYFTRHLAAVERDPFGVEISTLALTLADFPNPNGWNVQLGDVFEPGVLSSYLKRAGVVLCNPPFADFTREERRRYEVRSTKKPVELLNRVLDDLHPQGVLGFVLPRLFIDGRGYAEVRKRISERFATLHIASLPDRAFTADVEIALLIATDPIPHSSCQVSMRTVSDTPHAWREFELRHEGSKERHRTFSMEQAQHSLSLPELTEVWSYLTRYPALQDHADIGRGLEWNEPLRIKGKETGNRNKFVKPQPTEGYILGVAPLTKFHVFQVPEMSYLSAKPEDQRGSAWKREWARPKAILNKSARSRGAWRLAAFPDAIGLACYQTFIGVWPRSDRYDEWALAAILNSPVANAFVAVREGKTDVTIDTLRRIPVPRFTQTQAARLREMIILYQSAIRLPLEGGESSGEAAERLLKEIDALVLSAYRLPPRLERELLDFFRGHDRPAPHGFGDYFPSGFEMYFSLFDYLSPGFTVATVGDAIQRDINRRGCH